MTASDDLDKTARRSLVVVVAVIVVGAVGAVLYLLLTSEVVGGLSPG